MEPKNLKSTNNRTKNIIFAVIVILLIGVLFVYGGKTNNPEKIELNQLEQLIQENKVAAVYTQEKNEIGKILLKESEFTEEDFPGKADYWFVYNDNSNDILNENRTKCDFNWINDVEAVDTLSYMMPLLYVGLAIFSIILVFKMINRSNNKAMSFGKNKARVNENVTVKFSDVAGIDEEKEELKEIVDFLKNPKKFSNLGARIPKGVLLVGLPGTGKTLLAKAIAGESNVPFFSISGSDFVEMFVGVGASRVRDLFEQAKRNMPCIVFIDEIDAVGRQRGAGLGGGNDEREQTLNQLLVQMDGFEANEGIIVIAATNRADVLDPALTRPGRFDRQIYVYPPDVKGREEIIAVHAKGKPLADDVDFKAVARLTSGFTGADIESLLNEAALLCAKENRLKITMRDITDSVNKVMLGAQKKSRIVTAKDREITAYHEAGHAIIGKALPNCDTVQEVSIIPRGMAAGYTLSRDDDDNMHMSRNKLNDMLAMMMGGRIAEDIAIGDITTGAQNDIQRATSIARRMVVEWGMTDKLGFMGFDTASDVFVGRDYTKQMVYSEELASEIDREIKVILDNNYARAKEILNSKRSVLDEMVKVLLEKETIYAGEVDMLFEGKTAEEVFATMNEKEVEVKKSKSIEMFKSELEQNKQKLESKIKGADYMQKVGMLSDVEKRNLISMVEKQCAEERNAIIAKYVEMGLSLEDIQDYTQGKVELTTKDEEVNNENKEEITEVNDVIDAQITIEEVVNEVNNLNKEQVEEVVENSQEEIVENSQDVVNEDNEKKKLLSKLKNDDKKKK